MTPRECVCVCVLASNRSSTCKRARWHEGRCLGAAYLQFFGLFSLCKERNRMLHPAEEEKGLLFINRVDSAVLHVPCLGQGNSQPCRALRHLSSLGPGVSHSLSDLFGIISALTAHARTPIPMCCVYVYPGMWLVTFVTDKAQYETKKIISHGD